MSVHGFSDLLAYGGLEFLDNYYCKRASNGRTISMARPKREGDVYTVTWDFNIHNPRYKEKYSINGEYHIELTSSVTITSSHTNMSHNMFAGCVISKDTLRGVIQNAIDNHDRVTHKCVGYLYGIDKSNDRPFDIEIYFHYEKLNLFTGRFTCFIPAEMADEWYGNYARHCEMFNNVPKFE